ncbi:MAG: NAD(P)H-dependent oxidoreductase [Sphingobacteriales bacterium]|nr:MAG: NAD(P)H-dependent oxidoreductase [Sphingobacteriales bacterium]
MLKPIANNQPQITEASHVLIFAAYDNITDQHVDDYINNIATTRGIPVETLDDFRGKLSNIAAQPAEQNFTWAARQTYIALGTGLIAAAYEGVDATPMEGFHSDGVDEILGLKAKGLKSVSILTLGYRDEANDFMAPLKKVRKSYADLFELV